MKILKKICMALLLAVLCGAIFACGSDLSGVIVLEDSAREPEYLSFFSHSKTLGTDVVKYWSDSFMKTYNRKVYIELDGADYYAGEGLSYRELLVKRLESDTPDDLYIINAEDVLEFEKRGYWMDLSGMDFVDSLSEAALYQSTYNGKVFSVPMSIKGFGFIWNTGMLKEHGLSVPQNRGEFLSVCETLKSAGILPYGANKGYALTVPAMCAGFSELYAGDDRLQLLDALNSGETPVSGYMRDGFEFLSMMIERGYMDAAQALADAPNEGDLERFAQGGCAFICTTIDNLPKMPELPFEIQLTGLPVLEDGSVCVYGAGSRLCVNPNSRKLETALAFIEMVGSPQALAKSARWEMTISAAKDGGASVHPSGKALAELLMQPDQIPNQDFALHFNTWESIRDVSRELCGGASVDEACAMLDDKQRADLDAYAA